MGKDEMREREREEEETEMERINGKDRKRERVREDKNKYRFFQEVYLLHCLIVLVLLSFFLRVRGFVKC